MLETSNKVILNLGILLNHDDESELLAEGLLLPSEELLKNIGLELTEPINWQLTVTNTGGENDFLLEGELRGNSIMECRRCLEPARAKIDTEFVYQMEYQQGDTGLKFTESEDLGETLIFGNPVVDFSAFITEMFTMSQPLTAVCKEDCKGLNNEGVNLNLHPEAVDKTVSKVAEKESPFASLKDFEV